MHTVFITAKDESNLIFKSDFLGVAPGLKWVIVQPEALFKPPVIVRLLPELMGLGAALGICSSLPHTLL